MERKCKDCAFSAELWKPERPGPMPHAGGIIRNAYSRNWRGKWVVDKEIERENAKIDIAQTVWLAEHQMYLMFAGRVMCRRYPEAVKKGENEYCGEFQPAPADQDAVE